ncbi:hypothetical protein ACG7TL_002218 [Trametes sanguinea]
MSDADDSLVPLDFDLDLGDLFSAHQGQLSSQAVPHWPGDTVFAPGGNLASTDPALPSDENSPPVTIPLDSLQAGPSEALCPQPLATGLSDPLQPFGQRPPLLPSTLQAGSNVSPPSSEILKAIGDGNGVHAQSVQTSAAAVVVAQSANADSASGFEPDPNSSRPPPVTTRSRGGTASRGRGRGGRGSKSGPLNRRSQGISDDEISKLDDEAKAVASIPKATGLTEEEKLKVVEYVTDERRWSDFRVKQNLYWIELSQQVFKGRVTVTQISNYWHNQAWEKYKACVVNLVKPTGGGDGDDDWYGETDTEGSTTQSEGQDSRKRKRALKERLTNTKFSRAVLEEFLHSKHFELIHRRAKDDSSVQRERSFNSTASLSDSDNFKQRLRKRARADNTISQVSDPYFEKTYTWLQEHTLNQSSFQQRNLELAERRDRREADQWRMQQQLQRREIQQFLTSQQPHTVQLIIVRLNPIFPQCTMKHLFNPFILLRVKMRDLFRVIPSSNKEVVKHNESFDHTKDFLNVFTCHARLSTTLHIMNDYMYKVVHTWNATQIGEPSF